MKKVLFLTLNTFSATGGIEKVCRVAGKALHEIMQENDGEAFVYSMHDKHASIAEPYFPTKIFRGFQGRKIKFVLSAINKGRLAEIVILSHINLLSVGYLIKKLSPKTKLFLIAHGIEVWEPQSGFKNRMMKAVDVFLPVSTFTGQKLKEVSGIAVNRIKVLNNCLDPYMKKVSNPSKEAAIKKSYGFKEDDFVLLTLTRIKFSEQYKGYDKVIEALAHLKDSLPNLKYLIVGKYDEEEKSRLDKLISEKKLNNSVVFTGFINDDDIPAHFNLADLYIMPSTGEGFGVVFIEALFYGKAVIAGNVDGSVDALANGEFGLLVNPNNIPEIANAIVKAAKNRSDLIPNETAVVKKFGYEQYKNQWRNLLTKKFIETSINNFYSIASSNTDNNPVFHKQ